jgi:pyrimidine-nucleoside phosphorylase
MSRVIDIIRKKRDGLALTPDEIQFLINGIVSGEIPDYQASAFLMAAFIRGLNDEETIALTDTYMHSGDVIDLSNIPGIKVDKHSTGGVGDKTTIVLAPLVAAAGCKVAKISGRGMGHTGGTVDKFKAFTGISMELDPKTLIENVKEIGVGISGQTANLVPADKKIYALRDVTATVPEISLITASIMSKKLASGANAIVLDVKTGSGSFLTEYEDSLKLAKTMVEIGKSLGRKTVAIISNMAEPLGCAVGNINEVIEAIEVLKGNGPQDVHELCMVLGAEMLCLSEQADSTEEARERLEEAISSGAALDKLRQLVSQQGGDATMVDNIDRFEKPTESLELRSTEAGYITQLDARTVGESSMILGAGRETVDAVIDMTAGIYLYKKCGDHVNKGDVLAKLENRNAIKLQKAVDALKRAYLFSERKGNIPRLILHRID